MKDPHEFPDWDTMYKETNVEEMPWYEKNLDPDLEHEIKTRNLNQGRFLDLGTGPGTQAIQLAKLGFEVTGADISVNAIQKAKKISNNVNFIQDDFLNSKLPNEGFDFILDRGCFHVMEPSQRTTYMKQITRILDKGGILFLKCFSDKEKNYSSDNKGPQGFSKKDIKKLFIDKFEIDKLRETVYHGTLNPLPKALFAVLKKK